MKDAAAPSLAFTLNGQPVSFDADPRRRLSDLLRESGASRGTKVGCDAGDCGACTVLVDGAPVCACLTACGQVEGAEVLTVEGLAEAGRLSRLQSAFLRHGAAQCGICTPGMLVAASALLADVPRPSEAQAQAALGGVLCRCTGYRKIIAAVCDAWREDVADPAPEPGAAVGARLRRLDGPDKVTGAERFGADDWPESALLLKAVRSPHPHARFRFGDLAEFASRPGVAVVLTAADVPGRNRFGVIPPFADQPALAESPARFRGEAVALVGFEPGADPDLTGFPISWEALPDLSDPVAAQAEDAPLLHHDRPGNRMIRGYTRRGDARAALADSAFSVEGCFETPFIEHAYIEPEAGSAWLDGDTLVIRACTQAPVMDRDDCALVLGLPPERVRILPTGVGGGFGSKLDLSVQPLLGLAVLKTGRPVRMVYSRRESLQASTKRHPSRITARIGCDAEGHVTAMQFHGIFDTGAYASWGPTVANRVPVHASGPYRTPNIEVEAWAVHTNGPVAGAFRGFGVPQAAIAQELLYDRLADAAGLDRLEFRLRNAFRDGDTTGSGQVLAATGIHDCLSALREPWTKALADAARANAADGGAALRGVGVASCWYGCGNTALPNPSTIRVGLTAAGELVLHQGATDIGQGANTVITQICADALGLPVSDFRRIGPDTARTPDAGKTSASRQTYVTGRAAAAAGAALRREVLRLANAGDGARLRLEDGALIVEDGAVRRIELAALPEDARGYALSAEESYDPPTQPLDADGQGVPYAVYGYGAQMVELEVDPALGKVRLLNIVAAHDLGRAINPLLAEGQIEGGIAQGIGLAMMEEYRPGRTENLHDYLIPTIGDVPPVRSILIEKPDPEGPFGARGLGEHVLIPTAPAILNAIRHASGAELTRLPALPHRVLAALRRAGK
ncbi:molybdopterin-dependent oxidoreductase [Frigidibacter sp. ROC022]|uniref:molybdopterin-dependent oxidoreductase n=1 Tax=Frigidibacter sp. ROC022 TaxID=2971796 RepID=UPI00215AC2D2|nr:molybdopterin cofactor-binding domain-containing protein [Frigidibacter sp. ROC022]MCR8725007.1 molybdopterin-dependent oxidoreductase [Frigidibacter sp. ROC022]